VTYDLVQNDTGSKLVIACVKRSDGQPVDLTGATVTLKFRSGPSAILTQAMTVTDATNGIAEYQFLTGELLADEFKAEVEVLDAGGKLLSSLSFIQHRVRPKLT
jgi:hypothetical protein